MIFVYLFINKLPQEEEMIKQKGWLGMFRLATPLFGIHDVNLFYKEKTCMVSLF